MASGVILEVQNLTKKFGGLVAVNDVSFQMNERTIHSLIGPNGSGKTTTINLIHGVFPPTSGRVMFNGKDITGKPNYELAKMGIGRTYQNIKLFKTMSVLDNLLVGGDYMFGEKGLISYLLSPAKYKRQEQLAIEKAEEILNFLCIYHLKDETVSNLAYGRQKVTELGRTLMGDPSIILLDEPAAGLNPSERKEFVGMLEKTFESGVDLFLIEHNMDVVMNISHKITVLNFGSKIAEGEPSVVQNDPQCIKAYLGDRYVSVGREVDA